MVDLSVEFAGLILKNPVIVESAGYIVDGWGLKRMIRTGAGAVVTKSNTYRGFEGGPTPRCYWYEDGTSMNGDEALLNPGFRKACEYIKENKTFAEREGSVVIASFSPRSVDEAVEMGKAFQDAGAQAIHMDLQCPTAAPFRSKQYPGEGWEKLGSTWSEDPQRIYELLKALKGALDIPVIPKPIVFRWIPEPEKLELIASARPDGIAFMGPTAPMLFIDIYTGKPMKGSRPGRFRVTLKLTADAARIVKTDLLPSGGIATVDNVIEIIMAGAPVAGICTAVYKNYNLVQEVVQGLTDFMVRQQFRTIDEFKGATLRHLGPRPGPESNFYNTFLSKYIKAPEGDYIWGGTKQPEPRQKTRQLESEVKQFADEAG